MRKIRIDKGCMIIMKIIRRFISEIKRYNTYVMYSTRANLKAEVAGSYLNWVWWVLEPLGMMIVYAVLFGWLFKQNIEFFPVFIFIGNAIWGFFSKVMSSSVSLMKMNGTLISKIYIPKYILLLVEMLIDGFKMLIQFILTAVLMVIFRVPISLHVFWVIPVIITLFVVTFGMSSIMLDWGVYIDDLSHAISIILTVWMYFSGIFFDIKTMIPEPASTVIYLLNPIAFLIAATRDAVMYCKVPNLLELFTWMVLGLVFSGIGIKVIYKHENDYVKRM